MLTLRSSCCRTYTLTPPGSSAYNISRAPPCPGFIRRRLRIVHGTSLVTRTEPLDAVMSPLRS